MEKRVPSECKVEQGCQGSQATSWGFRGQCPAWPLLDVWGIGASLPLQGRRRLRNTVNLSHGPLQSCCPASKGPIFPFFCHWTSRKEDRYSAATFVGEIERICHSSCLSDIGRIVRIDPDWASPPHARCPCTGQFPPPRLSAFDWKFLTASPHSGCQVWNTRIAPLRLSMPSRASLVLVSHFGSPSPHRP